MSKKSKILAAMFKSYARDASTEEVAEAMEAVNEAKDECTAVKDSEEEKGILTKIKDMFEGKPAEETTDEDTPSVEERLAKLEDLLSKMAATKDEEIKVESDKDDIIEDDEELEEEVRDEEKVELTDSAIRSLRRNIARISNAKDRKMMSDALRVSLRGSSPVKDNGYSIISEAMKKSAMTRDSAVKANDFEGLGRRIAAKYNPHFNKGE